MCHIYFRVRFSQEKQDDTPLTEMSPINSDTTNPLSQGTESKESADGSALPCTCGAAKKMKITQDELNQMQYEVLAEKKKKLIAQTKYYNLMNEDALKQKEKLNAELTYYKYMNEKLRKETV